MGKKINKGIKVGMASAVGIAVAPSVTAFAAPNEQAKQVDNNTEMKKEVPVVSNDTISVGDSKDGTKSQEQPKEQPKESNVKVQPKAKVQSKAKVEEPKDKQQKVQTPAPKAQPMSFAALNQKDDLEINIGTITGTQSGPTKPTQRQSGEPYYVPGKIFTDNIFPTDGNPYGVVARNNNITVRIPFSLRSKSGTMYKLKGIKFVGSIKAHALNENPDRKNITPGDFNSYQDINLDSASDITENVTCTSTGTLELTANIYKGWKNVANINGDVIVTFEDGTIKKVHVETPSFAVTTKDDEEVYSVINAEKIGKNNEWNLRPFFNLPYNSSLEKFNFKDSIGGARIGFELTDSRFYIESNDPNIIVDNTNHLITFKGQYLKELGKSGSKAFDGKLLLKFKGEVPEEGVNCTIITKQPKDGFIDWLNNATYPTSINYKTLSTHVKALPNGSWTVEQKAGSDSGETTVEGLGGKVNVLSVAVYANKQEDGGILLNKKYLESAPDSQRYYSFDKSIITKMKSQLTKEQVDQILASKVYTRQELLDLYKSGKEIPFIGAVSDTGTLTNEGKVNVDYLFGTYDRMGRFDVGMYSIITSDDNAVIDKLHHYYNKNYDVVLPNGILLRNSGSHFNKPLRYGSESDGYYGDGTRADESQLTIEKTGYATSRRPDSTRVQRSWLKEEHILDYSPFLAGSAGEKYDYSDADLLKAGSTITIDMGRTFKLTETPTFYGIPVDYRIEGNKLILTTKQDIKFSCSKSDKDSASNTYAPFRVKFKYTDYSSDPIDIKVNSDVDFYSSINNKYYKQYKSHNVEYTITPITDNILSTGHVAGEEVDGIIDMHDYICNKEKFDQEYWVMSTSLDSPYNMTCTNGKNNDDSQLSFIESFGSGDIYYITKSKLKNEDYTLLRSNNLTKENIEYVKNNWIKYNGETLPNDVVGFVKREVIKPGSSRDISYNLRQKIRDCGKVYSQFKYLNVTSNTNTTSNIVELKGRDVKHKITERVITTDGQLIMPDTLVAEGHPGTSLDFKDVVKFEIPKYYKLVRVEQNGHEVISSEDGLDLFSLYAKGFIPGQIGDKDDSLVFVIEPLVLPDENSGVDCITVYDGTGEIVPNSKKFINGGYGTYASMRKLTPVIPDDCEWIKTILNGQQVDSLPRIKFEDRRQHIIYVVKKKYASDIVQKTVLPDGTVVGDVFSQKGVPNAPIQLPPMNNQSGYKFDYVTINGKRVSNVPFPYFMPEGHTEIVYHLKKAEASYVEQGIFLVDHDGNLIKVLDPVSKIVEGAPGTSINLTVPNYDTNKYILHSVNANGAELTPEQFNDAMAVFLPNIILPSPYTIIYKLEENPNAKKYKVYEKVVNETGTVLEPDTLITEGAPNSSINYNPAPRYTIPKEFECYQIDVDGKTVAKDDNGLDLNALASKGVIPNKIGDHDEHIVYHIKAKTLPASQSGVTAVTYYKETMKEVPNSTFTQNGPLTTNVDISKLPPVIPQGYHLVKTIVNDKEVNQVPQLKYMDKTQKIVYVVEKIKGNINIRVEGSPGHNFSYLNSNHSGPIGDVLNNTSIELPKGYKISSATLDGKTFTPGSSVTYKAGTQEIVYHLSIKDRGHVNQRIDVVDANDNIVREYDYTKTVASGYIGDSITVKPLSPIEGYDITKVIIDGKPYSYQDAVAHLPKLLEKDEVNIQYHITPKACNVNVKVVSTDGKDFSNLNYTQQGKLGQNVAKTSIQVPEGYKIVSTTLDGNLWAPSMGIKYKENTQNIIYTISPKPKYKVMQETDLVDESGKLVKVLEPLTQIESGYVDSNIMVMPKEESDKYEIVKVIINGTPYSANDYIKALPTKITNGDQKIVYKVRPRKSTIDIKVVSTDGKDFSRLNRQITGNVGDTTSKTEIQVPSTYNLVSSKIDKFDYKMGDEVEYTREPQTIVYTISPKPKNIITRTVNLVDDNDKFIKVLTPEQTVSEDYVGETPYIKPFYLATGYKIVKVHINGVAYNADEYESHMPKTITNNKQTIVYDLAKIKSKLDIKVVSSDGKDFSNLNRTVTGYVGEETKDDKVNIPDGYTVTSTTLDGNAFNTYFPVHFKEGGSELVYHITPKPHNKIMQEIDVIDDNGKLMRVYSPLKQIGEGYVGESVRIPLEECPISYDLVNVIINGKTYSADDYLANIPREITNSEQKIVYQIRPKKSDIYVKVVSTDGKDFSSMNYSRTGYIGDTTSDLGIKVPEGYRLVKAETMLGDYKMGTPVPFIAYPQTVTYTISPIPNNTITETVNVVDKSGKVIRVLEPTKVLVTSYIGHKETINPYSYDTNKYTLTSVNIDGKNYDVSNFKGNLPTEIKDHSQAIIYNLVQNPSSVKVKTVLTDGTEIGTTQTINGFVGDSVKIPSENTKAGYHLEKTTVNGKDVANGSVSDVTLVPSASEVIYTLAPNPKGNVIRTVKVVDKTGKLVKILEADKEIASGLSGTSATIPSYSFDNNLYSLKSDTIDGQGIVNENKSITLKEGTQHQVITLVQNYGAISYMTVDDTKKQMVENSDGLIDLPRGTVVSVNGKQVIPTGYKLTGVTLNDKNVNLTDLNNLVIEKEIKDVVFHVSKIYNATNTMVGTDGHVFSPVTVIGTGIKGDSFEDKVLTNPSNYHLVRVEITSNGKTQTINGKDFNSNALPVKFENSDIVIKYVVEINKGTVDAQTIIEGQTTPVAGSVEHVEGITGTSVKGITPKVIPGYRIKEVTLNGKTSSQDEVNKLTFSTGNHKVVYVLTPLPNNSIVETVNVVDKTGKVIKTLEKDKQLANDYLGHSEVINLYNYDKDLYSLKNMSVDGKEVSYDKANLPTEIKDHAIHIVYNLVQNPSSVHIKTVTDKGEVVGKETDINGFVGDKENVPSYNVKPGYHLSSTTVNGKEVKEGSASTITLTPNKQEIVYVLSPNPTGRIKQTVNVLDKNGKIIKVLEDNKEVASGLSGLDTTILSYNVDDSFYDLDSVTVNGNASTNTNHEMKFTAEDQHIVINLRHKYGNIYVKTVMPNGTVVQGSQKSYNDLVGDKVDLIGAVVPKGYHVSRMYGAALEQGGCNLGTFDESYDYNGKAFDKSIPSMIAGRLDQSVTYVLAPNPTGKVIRTVNVINPYTGKVVKVLENKKDVCSGLSGTDGKLPTYTFDNTLYDLTSNTFNGKAIDNKELPLVFNDGVQEQIINLTQRKGDITVSTITTDGTPVGETKVIKGVIGENPEVPGANTKAGYHVSKITVDGKEVPANKIPSVTITGHNKVVYTLSPNPTGIVKETVRVVNKNGNLVKTLISNKQVASGLSGTDTTVPIYNYDKYLYTKVSSTLNGKDYTEGSSFTITEKPQSIVITLKENYGNIKAKTIIEGTSTIVEDSEINKEGVTSTSITGITPKVNPGYTLTGITIDGKKATQEQVNALKFTTGTQEVVYTVKALPDNTITETVNVLDKTGKVIKVLESNKVVAKDYLGHDENIDLYNYDKDLYSLKNVTLNGKEIKYDKASLPNKITDKTQSIVYNLVQNENTITVTTKTTTGEIVGTPSTITGFVGQTVTVPGMTTKPGYHLEKITVNGKEVKEAVSTSVVKTSKTEIVYVLAPNAKGMVDRTVNIIDPYTHKVVKTLESNNVILSGLSETKGAIPRYDFDKNLYDLTSDTLDGKDIKNETQTITIKEGTQHQVINLTQKPSRVKVVTKIDGNVVNTPKITNTVIGSSVDIASSEVVPGYHVGTITINGKVVSNVPSKITITGNIDVVYKLVPNAKSSVVRTVIVINPYTGKTVKTLVNNESIATGLSGQTIGIKSYNVNKDLYDIVSVTLNGKPFENKDASIKLTDDVQKEVITLVQRKANVKIKTVTPDGKVVGKENVINGVVSDKVKVNGPETLKGYHLEKITINGQDSKNVPVDHVLTGSDEIVYTIVPNDQTTIKQTIVIVNKNGDIIKTIEKDKLVANGAIDTDYNWSYDNSVPNTYIKTISIDGKDIPVKDNKSASQTITFDKDGSNVLIKLVKKENSVTYKTVDEQGNIIPNSTGSVTSTIGDYVNIEGKEVVPPYYEIVKITLNGKEISREDLKNILVTDKANDVVFVVAKKQQLPDKDASKDKTPKEPVKPEKPVEPVKPEKPAQPVKPEKPVEPVKPAKPEKPETPVEPKKEAPLEPKKETPSEPKKETPLEMRKESKVEPLVMRENKPENPMVVPTPKEVKNLEDTGLTPNALADAEVAMSGIAVAGVFSRLFKKRKRK